MSLCRAGVYKRCSAGMNSLNSETERVQDEARRAAITELDASVRHHQIK